MIVSLVVALLVLCPFVIPTACSRLRKRGEWVYVGTDGAPAFQNGWRNARTREPSGHLH